MAKSGILPPHLITCRVVVTMTRPPDNPGKKR
jgi:hypothetical protein